MVVKRVVTEEMPRGCVAHTLTAPDREENVRTWHFFHSQEIISHCGCFTAVVYMCIKKKSAC